MVHIPSEKFARDTMAALSESDRSERVRELEEFLNPHLKCHASLSEFQNELYALIDQLNTLGHYLGRWEYDCEVEYWGGKSYVDQTIDDELLLRSEYPHGLRLVWGDFEQF